MIPYGSPCKNPLEDEYNRLKDENDELKKMIENYNKTIEQNFQKTIKITGQFIDNNEQWRELCQKQQRTGAKGHIKKIFAGCAAGILTLGIAYVNLAKISASDVYRMATGEEKTLENLTTKTENEHKITFQPNNYRSLTAIYHLDEKCYGFLQEKILSEEEKEGKMDEDKIYKMLRELDKNHDMRIDEKEIIYPASSPQR